MASYACSAPNMIKFHLEDFVTLSSHSFIGLHVLSHVFAQYEHGIKQFLHCLKGKNLHALSWNEAKSTTWHPLVFILDGPMPSRPFMPVHMTHHFNVSPPPFRKGGEQCKNIGLTIPPPSCLLYADIWESLYR